MTFYREALQQIELIEILKSKKISKYILRFVVGLSFAFITSSFAEEKNEVNVDKINITIDKNVSPYVTSDLVISIKNIIKHSKYFDINKNDSIVYNTGKIALGIPMLLTLFVGNHEVGGHVFRAWELGYKVTGIKIAPLSGRVDFDWKEWPLSPEDPNSSAHWHEVIAFRVAGVQASNILSEKLKKDFISINNIDPISGFLYILSSIDQSRYAIATKWPEKDSSHDMANYVKEMNTRLGYPENILSKKQLQYSTAIDLINPYLYYSLYSILTNSESNIPMIQLTKNIGYLPSTRLVLTPWGLEYKLQNDLRIKDQQYNHYKYMQLNISYGSNDFHKSWSLGIDTNYVLSYGILDLGFKAIYWNQPKLFTDSPKDAPNENGGLLVINSRAALTKNFGIVFSAGYKSQGFIEGEPIAKGAFFRGGLSYNL